MPRAKRKSLLSRQVTFVKLAQTWNETPYPFFAGLTPAQVMEGGGSQEAELAEVFQKQVEQLLKRRTFEGEGEALIETLMLLRQWQGEPVWKGRIPVEVIVAERNELLERRARMLNQRGAR